MQDSRRTYELGDTVLTIFGKYNLPQKKSHYKMMKHFKTNLLKHANASKVVTLGRYILFLKGLPFGKSFLWNLAIAIALENLEKIHYG